MNENIDLTKILEGCPQGTKLYSPLFGEVEFVEFSKIFRNSIVVKCDTQDMAHFSKEGWYFDVYENAECLLFPSKEQRDWDKFERSWNKPTIERFDINTFQPFDKVLTKIGEGRWRCGFFSHILEDDFGHKVILTTNVMCIDCVPYNDETKHLLGTEDDCPEYYKWWEK